jgi:hypothetical protein
MKRILAIALVLASTLVTAGTSSAQDYRLKATVPFNFTVGERTLPAGTYMIGSAPTSPEILTLMNWQGGVNILAVGQPDSYNPKRANVLVFHKYGDQYFLSEIRSEGASMNIDFAVTKAEKRARTQVEEAGRFVDDPVLIALNQ